MMSRVLKGVLAGLAATTATALLEAANSTLGPWAVSFPLLLSVMADMGEYPAVGWIAHGVVGTFILGPAFALLCPRLPTDTAETKGIAFAVGAFVVMGLTIAPLAGVGPFGARAGFGSLAWLIAIHALFGIVLGNVYGRMAKNDVRSRRQAPRGGAFA